MKKIILTPLIILVLFSLASCGLSGGTTDSEASEPNITDSSSGEDSQVEPSESSADTTPAELVSPDEEAEDYAWSGEEVFSIQLADNHIVTDFAGVVIGENSVTITSAGNYEISGTLSDGQILVDTEDEGIVRLILNGAAIHNDDGPAIDIENAEKVMVYLVGGSQNQLTDGSNYTLTDPESDEPNATLFSKSDLIIDGTGSLLVLASYNDAISSKDGLIINNGVITINAIDDGLRGKDYIVIHQGTLDITAEGDGMKADEQEDASKGYIQIDDGSITIVAGMDAIDAETVITITAGTFNLTAGGGSGAATYQDVSMKGIKGLSVVNIHGGNFTINSADDAIHSNGDIVISNGNFSISTGDDGIHSDTSLTIDGGQIAILQSYEGLESALITINGGDIAIAASDDGINVAGGADGSGMDANMGGRPGRNTGPGFDMFTGDSGDYFLYINGGTIYVNANGDGIDSNGSIEVTGGVIVVNGPTNTANGALDYLGTFNISGGTLVAAGSSGMAQGPSTGSTQAGVLLIFNGTVPAGETINVANSSGETIFTFTPVKDIQSIVFSLPNLSIGETYTISYGGSASETSEFGLVIGGSYSGGTVYTTLTLSSIVTQVGSGGGFGGGGRR